MVAAVHVPGELIEDILSRVPVKSILRFKTASKQWYSLFSQNHQFAKFHLKRSKDNHPKSTFIFQTSIGATIFETLNIDTNASSKFNFPVEIDTECELIGSANGLVCVARSYKGSCFIWNPSTGESIRISVPVRYASSMLCGFGYDSCSDDYKIVADWGKHFRVFSLKTNSWKIFQYSFSIRYNGFQFNGALHWCVNGALASFDLAKEVFSFIKLPELNYGLFTPLCEYRGLLYVSTFRSSNSIWMMKKLSTGKLAWVKSKKILAKNSIIPLGISALGEVVYRVKGGSGFVKSDIRGSVSNDDTSRIVFPFAFVYMKSLISPRCFSGNGLQPQSKKMIERPRKQRKTSVT